MVTSAKEFDFVTDMFTSVPDAPVKRTGKKRARSEQSVKESSSVVSERGESVVASQEAASGK